jgi:hypothetical protein
MLPEAGLGMRHGYGTVYPFERPVARGRRRRGAGSWSPVARGPVGVS